MMSIYGGACKQGQNTNVIVHNQADEFKSHSTR